MPRGYRVEVNTAVINSLFGTGGSLYRSGSGLMANMKRAAEITYLAMGIGIRTSELFNSIDAYFNKNFERGLGGAVRAKAAHAIFVHEGTDAVIYPHGESLWVPRAQGSPWKMRRDSVRGQVAKPFLAEGADQAILSYLV